jgi:hypothetical protein
MTTEPIVTDVLSAEVQDHPASGAIRAKGLLPCFHLNAVLAMAGIWAVVRVGYRDAALIHAAPDIGSRKWSLASGEVFICANAQVASAADARHAGSVWVALSHGVPAPLPVDLDASSLGFAVVFALHVAFLAGGLIGWAILTAFIHFYVEGLLVGPANFDFGFAAGVAG